MRQHAGLTWHGEFWRDGWTPGEYERAMRGAYRELKLAGIRHPRVDYGVAYQYHLRQKGRLER